MLPTPLATNNSVLPKQVSKFLIMQLRVTITDKDLYLILFKNQNESHRSLNEFRLVHLHMFESVFEHQIVVLIARSSLIPPSVTVKISCRETPA